LYVTAGIGAERRVLPGNHQSPQVPNQPFSKSSSEFVRTDTIAQRDSQVKSIYPKDFSEETD
jgi:hypothetical protein